MYLQQLLRHGSACALKTACGHGAPSLRIHQGCRLDSRRAFRSSWQASRAGRRQNPPAASVPDVFIEGLDPEITAFQQHQQAAPKPSSPEQARTLVAGATFAVLSTLHHKQAAEGFPFGSVVEIAADTKGRPIFAASSLSAHTRDLFANPRCCLTLLAAGWTGPQQARLTLVGNITLIKDDEKAQVREVFLSKHPSSFWVDFGDFSWFRLDDIKTGYLVPGFGGGYTIKPEEYFTAEADPVAEVSERVCKHMTTGHQEALVDMVRHYTGLSVEKAVMEKLDRLGADLFATRNGNEQLAVRLPYIRPVQDAKSLKEVLVEMSKTAGGESLSE